MEDINVLFKQAYGPKGRQVASYILSNMFRPMTLFEKHDNHIEQWAKCVLVCNRREVLVIALRLFVGIEKLPEVIFNHRLWFLFCQGLCFTVTIPTLWLSQFILCIRCECLSELVEFFENKVKKPIAKVLRESRISKEEVTHDIKSLSLIEETMNRHLDHEVARGFETYCSSFSDPLFKCIRYLFIGFIEILQIWRVK